MTKLYSPAQIEAGFRRWAEKVQDDPGAFMPLADVVALAPAQRAAGDAQELIRCMDMAPESAA